MVEHIYSYLSCKDIFLIVLASISAMAFGAVIPFVQLLDGLMIDTFSSINGND